MCGTRRFPSGNCRNPVSLVSGRRPMPVPQVPARSCVTVTEMAEMCQLSRSRFYDLIGAGVFPRPAVHPASGRPLYDHGLFSDTKFGKPGTLTPS